MYDCLHQEKSNVLSLYSQLEGLMAVVALESGNLDSTTLAMTVVKGGDDASLEMTLLNFGERLADAGVIPHMIGLFPV